MPISKGEMVLVVAGASELQNNDNQHDDFKTTIARFIGEKAAQLASDITGLRKNALYDRAFSYNG